MTMSQVLSNYDPEKTEVRVQYSDKQSYKTQSKKMGIMDDLKVCQHRPVTHTLGVTFHQLID